MGKSKTTTLILALVLPMFGIFGVHRFYTGHILVGVIQLLTGGGCAIWQIIDVITIFTGSYTDSDGQSLT